MVLSSETNEAPQPQRVIRPIEQFAYKFVARPLYSVYDTLNITGIMMVVVAWNYYFPAYARYRHQHWYRYRKEQAEFIRWICITKNFPKVYHPEETRIHKTVFLYLCLARVIQHFVLTMPAIPEVKI